MRISFIGSGNMTTAIVSGLIRSGRDLSSLCFYDHTPAKYAPFLEQGAHGADSLTDLLSFGELIVIAVKPQHFAGLYEEIRAAGICLEGKTLLSIAAGITIASMENALGPLPIIRAMPNTPLQVGMGITALCKNDRVNDEMWETAKDLFAVSGEVIILPEDAIPAVIPLTGSSPAYVFRFIKAIADGAREMAPYASEEERIRLAANAVLGSAALLLQDGRSPEALIRAVTSPKGTTEAANRVFENGGFAPLVADAMEACYNRAVELSKL